MKEKIEFGRIIGREDTYMIAGEHWHTRFLVGMSNGSTAWVETYCSFDPAEEEAKKSPLWDALVGFVEKQVDEFLKEVNETMIRQSNGNIGE